MSETTPSNTIQYPIYISKAACLAALEAIWRGPANVSKVALQDVLYGLSNTSTDEWADPTARHDS